MKYPKFMLQLFILIFCMSADVPAVQIDFTGTDAVDSQMWQISTIY